MLKVATHGERNKFCRGKCTRPWPLTSSAYQMLRIVKTKKKGVFGSWGGSHPLDIMEYTLAIDFLVILQLYQQVQQVRHVVSPTLLDHIGRALDTAAVAILQSLRPAGAGLQLLLDVQGRGFYAVLNACHRDSEVMVHAARWITERRLLLPTLAPIPLVATTVSPLTTLVPPTTTMTATHPGRPVAVGPGSPQRPTTSDVPIPVTVTEPSSNLGMTADSSQRPTSPQVPNPISEPISPPGITSDSPQRSGSPEVPLPVTEPISPANSPGLASTQPAQDSFQSLFDLGTPDSATCAELLRSPTDPDDTMAMLEKFIEEYDVPMY